jgi:hypothetical protein
LGWGGLVGLLAIYDPPARLQDFNSIKGQRWAWHRFMVEQFGMQIGMTLQLIPPSGSAKPTVAQFYDASQYDPGGAVIEQAVVWNAFPKELLRRYGRTRALVEADRLWPLSAYQHDWAYDSDNPELSFAAAPGNDYPYDDIFYRPTVEYCEWHIDRDAASGRIKRVAFTSEPPEYWQAMFGGRIEGSQIDFPGDRGLVLDLYRKYVNPSVTLDDLLVKTPFRSPFGHLKAGDYNPHNKWNTTHGAMHLGAPPNALTAEINLAAMATIMFEDARGALVVDPDAYITGTGFGGPNRNSDPTIAATVNVLARLGAMITLANPVGLYIDHIDLMGWETLGGGSPSEWVTITRGTPNAIERLVIESPSDEFDVSDVRIGGVPVRYGGQIAECITVKLVGAASALGAVSNPRAALNRTGYLDPANAREVFSRSRGGPRAGLVAAYRDEAAETEPAESVVAVAAARQRRRV